MKTGKRITLLGFLLITGILAKEKPFHTPQAGVVIGGEGMRRFRVVTVRSEQFEYGIVSKDLEIGSKVMFWADRKTLHVLTGRKERSYTITGQRLLPPQPN